MQESTTRLRTAVAAALIVAAIAVFAWFTHSSDAGAASTTPNQTTPAATQPYGGSSDAPAAGHRGPCPKDQQGSGGSGSQQQPQPAPSQGSSSSNL